MPGQWPQGLRRAVFICVALITNCPPVTGDPVMDNTLPHPIIRYTARSLCPETSYLNRVSTSKPTFHLFTSNIMSTELAIKGTFSFLVCPMISQDLLRSKSNRLCEDRPLRHRYLSRHTRSQSIRPLPHGVGCLLANGDVVH